MTYMILAIPIVSIICLAVMRILTDKGIGLRVIQYLGVTVVVPLIVISAIEGLVSRDALTGLLGAGLGWTLSTLAKDKETAQGEAKR